MYYDLLPYCVELGWIEFDEETKKARNITADSRVVDWKVIDTEFESAVDYLSISFPDADKDLIRKVVTDNLVHIEHDSKGNCKVTKAS